MLRSSTQGTGSESAAKYRPSDAHSLVIHADASTAGVTIGPVAAVKSNDCSVAPMMFPESKGLSNEATT